MKSKLILLLLLVSLIGFGQSVPNTTTFTLQNVVDVVNPTTDDLVDCFSDAVASYFNLTYEGSKNSLLNFRDYGPCQVYVSSGSLTSLTNTNSLTISYPAASAGDFVIIVANHYSSSEMSVSGWTNLFSHTWSNIRQTIFYKHFTATDAGGTVNITSSDYVTKFAVVHKIQAETTNTITSYSAFIGYPSNSYTTAALAGTSCEFGICCASLFISQSLGVSPGLGWTTRFNNWTSGIGASAFLTYNYSSTITAPANTFSFTGVVSFAYVNVLIE